MNTNLTEIAFILDRSGSMEPLVEQTIAGFNQFLRDQQALPGQARFTLVLFDDRIETPVDAVPVAEVVALDTKTYTTRGCTALLDAIGHTIDTVGARLAATPEADRPGKVIVAILTDGLENASERYSMADINQRITHQREVYQWEFLFLGANQDAIATASTMGIQTHNSATFAADETGVRACVSSLSRKSSAIRRQGMNIHTAEDAADLEKSTTDILREEEAKRKKGKKTQDKKTQANKTRQMNCRGDSGVGSRESGRRAPSDFILHHFLALSDFCKNACCKPQD